MTRKNGHSRKALEENAIQREPKSNQALTMEEIVAYREGSLTAGEESRLLARLARDKSAVQDLLDMENFPSDDEGEAMTETELDHSWQSFLRKVDAEKRRTPKPAFVWNRPHRFIAALAACYILTVGGLSAWIVSLKRGNATLTTPTFKAAFSDVFFDGADQRGQEPTTKLTLDQKVQTLGLHLSENWGQYNSFMVLLKNPSGETMYSERCVANKDRSLVLTLFRDFFPEPGTYKITVSGYNNGTLNFLDDLDLIVSSRLP